MNNQHFGTLFIMCNEKLNKKHNEYININIRQNEKKNKSISYVAEISKKIIIFRLQKVL